MIYLYKHDEDLIKHSNSKITDNFFLISSEKIEDEFERVQNEPFQKIFKLIFFQI